MVFYEQQGGQGATAAPQTMKAATPGPGGSSQISRLEARGGVTVTQKDQTATGDTGLFDMKSNTVTLTGNVVVSQGRNVLRGERLVVDLTTGVSRVEAGKSNGPVRMLIQQNQPSTAELPRQARRSGWGHRARFRRTERDSARSRLKARRRAPITAPRFARSPELESRRA